MVKSSKKSALNTKKQTGMEKVRTFILRHKIWVLIALLLIGIFGYKFTSIYLEKRDFLAKQKQLEQIADKIASQYPPDSRSGEEYCQYSHQKISKGDLTCTVGISLTYKNLSSGRASEIKDSIASALKLEVEESTYPSTGLNFFKYNENTLKWNTFSSKIMDNEHCAMGYYYEPQGESNSLMVDLSCWSAPRSELFPVKNN